MARPKEARAPARDWTSIGDLEKLVEIEKQSLDLARVMIRALDGTIHRWTRGMERLYGLSETEVVGRRSHQVLRTVFPRKLDEIEAELFDRGEWTGELIQRRRGGDPLIVSSHWMLHRDSLGRPLAVTEVNNERRGGEARLALASVLEASGDAIIGRNLNGVVMSWNKSAERIFGYTSEEALGRPMARLCPPDRLAEQQILLDRLKKGERIEHYETVRRRKDGVEIPISLTVFPIRDAGGNIVGASKIARDVTAQKRTQKQVQELQSEILHISRVNTMGQMASTIAHELNQPLTAVTNYLSALRRLLAGHSPNVSRIREVVDRAIEQSALAGRVLRHIRDFVAKGEINRRIENLNTTVEEAIALALIDAKQNTVQTSIRLEPDLAPVLIDKVQIQQVIMNLVRNALEAMESSQTRQLGIVTRSCADRRQVEVEVADSGDGIPEEITERLFEPFVSTKKAGMGLGLSICREIVESHGGALSALAKVPRGTIFSMILPVSTDGGACR